MEEVIDADQVFVMDSGHNARDAERNFHGRADELKSYRMDVPQVTMLAEELKNVVLIFERNSKKGRVGGSVMSIALEHVINYISNFCFMRNVRSMTMDLEIRQGAVCQDHQSSRIRKNHADSAFKRTYEGDLGIFCTTDKAFMRKGMT